MNPTPYLRNRRTGVILPYSKYLATHPDMVACEELPYKREMRPPEKPTTRRYQLAQAKIKAEAEKPAPAKKAPRKKAAIPEAKPGADIDDLLAGIEHG